MKISIPIEHDSWNSTPLDELVFTVGEDYVHINIEGDNKRTIAFSKEEFAKIARFCGI